MARIPREVRGRKWVGILIAFAIMLYLAVCFPLSSRLSLSSLPAPASSHRTTGLDIADSIYVISLKHRLDRRADMEFLAGQLGLHWSYVDAVPATDWLVNATLQWLNHTRAQRKRNETISWPVDIDILVNSKGALEYWDSTSDGLTLGPGAASTQPNALDFDMYSATEDKVLPGNWTEVPSYLRLSRSRIACWHSHLRAIHLAANEHSVWPNKPTFLILEDDVDMEEDISFQLSALWTFLPETWDIVFLGGRHSDFLQLKCFLSTALPQATVGRMKRFTPHSRSAMIPLTIQYHDFDMRSTRPMHPNAPMLTHSPTKAPVGSFFTSVTLSSLIPVQ